LLPVASAVARLDDGGDDDVEKREGHEDRVKNVPPHVLDDSTTAAGLGRNTLSRGCEDFPLHPLLEQKQSSEHTGSTLDRAKNVPPHVLRGRRTLARIGGYTVYRHVVELS